MQASQNQDGDIAAEGLNERISCLQVLWEGPGDQA